MTPLFQVSVQIYLQLERGRDDSEGGRVRDAQWERERERKIERERIVKIREKKRLRLNYFKKLTKIKHLPSLLLPFKAGARSPTSFLPRCPGPPH